MTSDAQTSNIAAHRGGSLEKPENTLEAFRYALGLGVEEIEFDVHVTRDGVAVVHHDSTLDRMTDATGPIADRTFAELQAVRINGSATETIPTLDTVLDLFVGSVVRPRIELKPSVDWGLYPTAVTLLVEALRARDLLGQTTVTSFFVEYLRAPELAAAALPKLLLVNPMVFFCIGGLDGLMSALKRAGTDHFALPIDNIDADLVADARGRGLVISAFAAHTEARIRKALDLGLPVFTCDRPYLALSVRDGAA
jgi:glycerophosphoryl diester phosphodiesterase